MNLRDIKKGIEVEIGAFIEDCSVVASVNENVSEEDIALVMEEAVDLFNELRDKVNAKIEGPKKAYYNALCKEIMDKTDGLYSKLSEVIAKSSEEKKPAEKKPAAKKPAAKKPAAKKAEAEDAAAEKPAAKKPAAKKTAAKKAEAE
ncbi:MAG: hypothetical protein J5764_01960 [Bacteroidales bacterium]|nr:hypothetical protein [Bacteroidales bacterium]